MPYTEKGEGGTVEDCIPVRPRTRVTFTSLTGTLEDSIGATDYRIEEEDGFVESIV